MKTFRIFLIVSLFIIVSANSLLGETIQKPFTFKANTAAKAAEVNQNFDILYSNLLKLNSVTTFGSNSFSINCPAMLGRESSITDFGAELLSGFYQAFSDSSKGILNNENIPDAEGWKHLIVSRHSSGNYLLQIGSNYTSNDKLFFRKIRPDAGNNPTWHEVATRGSNTFTGNQNISGSITMSGQIVMTANDPFIRHQSDNQELRLCGGSCLSDTPSAQLILYGGKSGVNPGAIEIHTGGVKSIGLGMRMYENGVTTFFGEKTTFKGQITATNCCTSSDIRLKKGIAPITHSLNKITSLKGVSYYWKTDEYPKRNFEDTKQIGLIAQEVETIIPEAVHTDHEGYKSIRYNKLTPVLIEAVKELKTKNDCLQQQINSQQKEIDELKSLVNQLIKNI